MTPNDDGLGIPPESRPDPAKVSRMNRAVELIDGALAELEVDIVTSPLGPGWSSDIDVHTADPERTVAGLIEIGGIRIGALLQGLGYQASDSVALREGSTILARIDVRADEPAPVAERIAARAARIEGGPDVRTVLELRTLARAGERIECDTEVLRRAAALEHSMGGQLLAEYLADTTQETQPHRRRSIASRLKAAVPRPQVRVAVSGTDGSGKSTTIEHLIAALDACSIPSDVVWTRPGMGLERLDRLAAFARRLLGQRDKGIRQVSRGDDLATISSRRGLVGWTWLMLVTVAFLVSVRRSIPKRSTVVIFDRHLLDALATLEVLYAGVDSRLHQKLIRGFIPRADLTAWLDVPPEVAAARKPDDLIGRDLVMAQYDVYDRVSKLLGNRLVRIQPVQPPDQIAADILEVLNARVAGTTSLWSRAVAKVRATSSR